jgi:hypothetical protein
MPASTEHHRFFNSLYTVTANAILSDLATPQVLRQLRGLKEK